MILHLDLATHAAVRRFLNSTGARRARRLTRISAAGCNGSRSGSGARRARACCRRTCSAPRGPAGEDRAADRGLPSGLAEGPVALLPHATHVGGHPSCGRDQRAARYVFRTGHDGLASSGISSLWGGPLRTPDGHLKPSSVQPAPLLGVRAGSGQTHHRAPLASADRRKPQAEPGGLTELDPGGLDAPRQLQQR